MKDPQAESFNRNKISQWPKSAYGAWVVSMIREYLKGHGKSDEIIDAFFDTPSELFGGMNAVQFVQHLVKIGNAESYADAWHEVLGTARRIYG